ncbi:MAG: hypothetical protein J7518_20960 [Nocardioidaceae bacterium]|nr:hypothetical protein [Nocardioidaceae bacterium]
MALLVTACGATTPESGSAPPAMPDHPERSAEAKERHSFTTLDAMVTTSPVVVRGTVVKVAPGRSAGESDADRIYFRNVTLQPDEVVKGVAASEPVTFEEEGYEADGTGYVVNGLRWSNVGDQGWYFLDRGEDGVLFPISSYGKFVLRGDMRGPTGHDPAHEGPWIGQPIGRPDTVSAHVRQSGARK